MAVYVYEGRRIEIADGEIKSIGGPRSGELQGLGRAKLPKRYRAMVREKLHPPRTGAVASGWKTRMTTPDQGSS